MVEKLTQIETKKESYTVDYPQAILAAEQQADIIWFAKELGVEKDESDIRSKCTEGERHGITTVLKLFTTYELLLGGKEYWGGKVGEMFPRPDIQRMAATFSFIELGVHAPFYALINETLNIATDEFYLSWKEDSVLSERMAFIYKFADSDDKLRSLAAFSFMEGAVLFSNFAYLKSFNVGGFNMIPHITSGIDASSKDENLHSMGAAWLYNQLLSEKQQDKLITKKAIKELQADIKEIAKQVYVHEELICEKIFEKGGIRTTTKEDILHFVRDRINMVLSYLNCPPLFKEDTGTITEWFYNQLNAYKYADFFSNSQVQYTRSWAKHLLVFRNDLVEQGE